MRRAFLGAMVLGALALAAGPRPAVGQDEDPIERPNDPGYVFYEAQAKKILKAAGDKLWDIAERAKRNGLFQFCYEQSLRAIKFNPNQPEAREYLGYVKKSKKWVLDPELAGKVKKQNQKSQDTSQESFEAVIDKWKEKYLEKANRFLAGLYAKLGDTCKSKGHPLQAIKGYESALRLDRDNAKARKGLGFKKFGKVWLTAKQDRARKDAAKGAQVKEESAWDGLLGTTLNKAQSEHFRLESTVGVTELMDILKTVETCYAYYLADLERDPTEDVFGRRARFCIMNDGDQWNKWVDNVGGANKEFTRKLGGTGNIQALFFGHRMKESSTALLRKDSVLHQTVHMLNHHVFRVQGRAWINEGLAYYYSLKVQETVLTYCVALRTKSKYGKKKIEGGLKDWQDPNNWKPNIKAVVAAKNDVPFRTLVNKPITELDFEATVKSWSIITWLMDDDRDQFIELMSRLGGVKTQEPIIEEVYGKDLETLDAAWRRYVIRNY